MSERDDSSAVLQRLQNTLRERKNAAVDESAGRSYVASLYAKGTEAICKKVAEEAAETIMAAKDLDHEPLAAQREHLVKEVADVWFHTLVLLNHLGLGADDVLAELARREGVSGIAEKASRPVS
jgi:phosphoribosyl-ATP pyrophosphohydrolase